MAPAAGDCVGVSWSVGGGTTYSRLERMCKAGASATSRSLNLDRHWRNARTVATHSPLAYKAHVAGNFAVNGTYPPANGYF